MPGTTIARGNISAQKIFALSLTPASVGAATTAEQTFTVPGVQIGDYVNCQFVGSQTAGISVANVRVTAANTIAIAFNNSTAGSLTPAAGVYGFVMGRPEFLPVPTDAT